jgi:serine/threonine protein kinase
MSPERIGGNSTYSYSADIWSFGLTVMAVALGTHPYDSTSTSSNSSSSEQQDSYWGLVQAIHENEPPVLQGDRFSHEFCDFIAQCLQKVSQHSSSLSQLQVLWYTIGCCYCYTTR